MKKLLLLAVLLACGGLGGSLYAATPCGQYADFSLVAGASSNLYGAMNAKLNIQCGTTSPVGTANGTAGIDGYINTNNGNFYLCTVTGNPCANWQLITGSTGATGPTGPTGPAGAGSGTINTGSNPQIAQYIGASAIVVGPVTVSGDASIANGGAVTVSGVNGGAVSGTSGNLASYGSSNRFADSAIVAANVNTAASNASAANQIAVSGGANKTTAYKDFPDVKEIPAANCNAGTAGPGWSIPASAAPTIACRGGTNNNLGVLQFAQSSSAQTWYHIPQDWNSSSLPFIGIDFTQGANTTASQTIIMQVQVACGTTDDTAFNTAQAFATATTVATANTEFTESVQLNSTSMTNCSAGSWMAIKILRSGADTAGTSPNVYGITLTTPRRIVNQAN